LAPSGGLRTINDVAARPSHKFLVLHFPAHVARVSAATFRETTVVSFIPCFYFLFLTVVAVVIIGLFNISGRVRQYPSTRIESNVIATKKNRASSCLHLKQNTDCLPAKQPTLLRPPLQKQTLKKASTTNQGRALTAASSNLILWRSARRAAGPTTRIICRCCN